MAQRWSRVPEPVRLALLPALISFVILWRALLGLGVFAPTDILLSDPVIAQRPPGAVVAAPQNPLLGDVIDTFLPWRLLVRDQVFEGRFPLWNPYNLMGTHLHANFQSQVLSPFNLLWLLLPPIWGLGAIAALKWTLTGLGMALLLRRLGLGIPAAIFGSVAFQLSGPVVAWLQWPIADGFTWLPWMMWAALGWLDARRRGWLVAFAALVAAEWLAGHVETTFHALVFTSVVGLAAWASGVSTPLRALLPLAGAGLLGTALAAAQWLPFLDVLPSSYQWWLRSRTHIAGFTMPPSEGLMWLAPHGYGWASSAPGGHNWIEDNPYVGALTLLLAATGLGFWILDFGFWRGLDSRSAFRTLLSPRGPYFWLGLLIVTLGMAYGVPPFSLLSELPGFSSSFGWRLISAAGFCLVVLGAMALDTLVGRQWSLRAGVWVPVAGLGVLVGIGFVLVGLRVWKVGDVSLGSNGPAWTAWAGAMFCMGAALLLCRFTGLVGPRALGTLAVALLLVDLGSAAWRFNPTSDLSTFYPKGTLLAYAAGRGPTERLAVVGTYAESNILAAYRVPDYRLYDATIDYRYFEYTRLMSPETFRAAFRTQNAGLTTHLVLLQPSATLLSAIGIKWVLSANSDDPNGWQPLPPSGPVYARTLTKNGFSIWENRYVLPYAYLSPRFHLNQGQNAPAEALVRMQTLSLDTRYIAQVEDPGSTFPGDALKQAVAPGESVTLQSYAPGAIVLRANSNAQRLLVVNEGWSPGWRAEVDGQPTPIYRTNAVVQGLAVPAGEHTIKLSYDPPAFRWGVGVSLVALGVWLVILWLSVVDRRPRTNPLPAREKIIAFWRMLHPVPSLLTVAAAGAFVLLAARGLPPPGRLVHLLLIEMAMQFAISAFNDYFDRRVDAGRADKPVAAGVITPRTAWATGTVLALLALALALPLGPWVATLTAIGLGGGLLYDAGLKYTAFSWLPFAIAFPTLALWAWAGAAPGGVIPPHLWWTVPVVALTVVGIHLADTIPDLQADAAAGVRGLAHRLGSRHALIVCWCVFAAGLLMTLALGGVIPYRLEWYLPGLLAGAALMVAGIIVYLRDHSRVRVMSLLLELGALALAVGWLGGMA